MNRLFAALAFGLATVAYGQPKYKVEIDLTATQNDQIPVVIYPPAPASDTVEYHMVKIVPGTYDISDFGRFVTDFFVQSTAGDSLQVIRLDTNRWQILTGGKPYRISYQVHDSFDQFEGYEEPFIFEPGGTNIESERSVFVINTFGFVGYINGQKFSPYEVTVIHPETLYGATALLRQYASATQDVFIAEDFNFLADGPIMYSVPDTITQQIANARVLVAVYSPNKVLSAEEVMVNITDLMLAQSEFLGGELPVDRYAYLIYLNDKPTLSGGMGALEHSYSSVYSLPEAAADQIGQTVRDVAAHEFFHIVTPLNIHSEEIGNFDYIEPKMSQHLWLYEGVTEYNSMLVQVKYELFSRKTFLDQVKEKVDVADRFPKGVAFTKMSQNILDPEFAPQYVNVYYKGALIGLCLDLYLIKYSNGTKNLQWLMKELAKKYGKNVSFQDDALFAEIEALTYPEIGQFLKTYVGGPQELPLTEVLSWAGVDFGAEVTRQEITLGSIGLSLNEQRQVVIDDLSEINEFGKQMKLREGDVLLKLNGEEFTLATAQQVIAKYKSNTREGDMVTMTVLREKKGKPKEVTLKAKAMLVEVKEKNVVQMIENPTESQSKIRELWLSAETIN